MAFSDTCFQVGATINAERTLTVPGASNISYQALFSYTYNSNVFVAINATPVVPVGGTTGTQPYNEFRPEKRYVKGGDVLHFITPDASAYIGVSLRQIQG
jgi:hypothetical protein